MKPFESKASLRRELALFPDAGRLPLARPVSEIAVAGPLAGPVVTERLASYLLDPRGGALLALDEDHATWLSGPLFQWVGPGNAVPHDDQLAALIVAPLLGDGTALAPLLLHHRFSPRADDAVAIAVAALELPAQAAALEALYADAGPEPELLALSLVQCGRVLAWCPHLLEWPIAERIVDALLARLAPTQPRPVLDGVVRALGPIARHPGPLGARVRAAALAGLGAATPAPPASFLAEVTAIGARRAAPDLDAYLALPAREVARACAHLLGRAAPDEPEAFGAYRARVLDRPDGDALLVPFVDGLVAAAHVPAVSQLVSALLEGSEGQVMSALGLAAQIPLDDLAPRLATQLDAPAAARRAMAVAALELIDGGEALDVDALLALRLGDPSPDVAAAAVRVLVARGRRDLVGRHSARDPHPVRRAVMLAGLGELSVAVVGELVTGALADLDGIDVATAEEDSDEVTPVTRLLADTLLTTVAGLDTAINLMAGVHDAVGLLALASLPGADRDVGILAPPQVRTRLAQATIAIAEDEGDGELGSLALYLLARMSAGDETIAAEVAGALTATDGHAGTLITALGELRVASAATGEALAPFLDPGSPIGARVAAAAVAGRALPAGHPAWAHVRELLTLGTIARAAAWTALRDRVRRQPPATT